MGLPEIGSNTAHRLLPAGASHTNDIDLTIKTKHHLLEAPIGVSSNGALAYMNEMLHLLEKPPEQRSSEELLQLQGATADVAFVADIHTSLSDLLSPLSVYGSMYSVWRACALSCLKRWACKQTRAVCPKNSTVLCVLRFQLRDLQQHSVATFVSTFVSAIFSVDFCQPSFKSILIRMRHKWISKGVELRL